MQNVPKNTLEVECGVVDWIELAQDWEKSAGTVNAVMNIWIT